MNLLDWTTDHNISPWGSPEWKDPDPANQADSWEKAEPWSAPQVIQATPFAAASSSGSSSSSSSSSHIAAPSSSSSAGSSAPVGREFFEIQEEMGKVELELQDLRDELAIVNQNLEKALQVGDPNSSAMHIWADRMIKEIPEARIELRKKITELEERLSALRRKMGWGGQSLFQSPSYGPLGSVPIIRDYCAGAWT